MTALHRTLPKQERYPLPPKLITQSLIGKIQTRMRLNEPELNALTLLAHVGYGAASGTLYAAGEQTWPGRPATKGIIFGLGVWAASYLGLLSWADVLTPATEHPARRNGLMIAAHLVWGAALGLLVARLK